MSKRTTIETKRLRLRVPRLDDAETWQRRIFGDPVVIRFLPVEAPLSLDWVRDAIPRALSHWTEHGYGLWVVEGRESGDFLGHCGLRFVDELAEVEVLYALAADSWGRGYATEAGAAAVRFGFEEAGLERILGLAFPENLASRRVMEKIGMRFEGERHAFGVDLVQYGLERNELRPTVEGYRLVGALGPSVRPPDREALS
jgi:ribosomal-protein-alanine N-acetyltransferase